MEAAEGRAGLRSELTICCWMWRGGMGVIRPPLSSAVEVELEEEAGAAESR